MLDHADDEWTATRRWTDRLRTRGTPRAGLLTAEENLDGCRITRGPQAYGHFMVDFPKVTPASVLHAVAEYDRMGQDEFLTTHGFGRSRGYDLVVDGSKYDSKAVLGVAHLHATGALATSAEFSGGRYGAAKVLKRLGFEVTEPTSASPEIIPATGLWREASDVGADAARDAWAGAARPVLLDVARDYHSVIRYKELADEVQRQSGIRTKQLIQHWIGDVLERVALDCKDRAEPILTSLVVDSSGSVGNGYASAVRTVTGATPTDADDHAAEERLRCHRHFEAPDLPTDGGAPALTPQMTRRRKRTHRQSTPPPRPKICLTCYIQLPSSGLCQNCG